MRTGCAIGMRRPAVLACGMLLAAVGCGTGIVAEASESDGPYARIAAAYMAGDWDALEKELRAAKDLAGLTPAEQADVAYVRQAMAECRPPWWNQCRAGRKTAFQTAIWGRTLSVAYEPAAQGDVAFKTNSANRSAAFSWVPADVDSTVPVEFGYLKCDVTTLRIWSGLGVAAALVDLATRAPAGLAGQDSERLNLYLEFRGNVAGLYYAGPPTRRWALHIFLRAYMAKYDGRPNQPARRAMASMIMAEFLKAPAKYPSLKILDTPETERTEEKLAQFLRDNRVNRNKPWTIPEDRAMREAVKAIAAANDREVLAGGRVALPSGLAFSMIGQEDAPLRETREAWIKAQFEKAAAK